MQIDEIKEPHCLKLDVRPSFRPMWDELETLKQEIEKTLRDRPV